MPVIFPKIIRIFKLFYLIAGYNLEQMETIVNCFQAKLIAKQSGENIPRGSLTVKSGVENDNQNTIKMIMQ